MMLRSLLLAGVVPIALIGCGGDDEPAAPDANRASVTYRFRDSSVEPEYHRSYTLDLVGGDDGAHGQLVVDSYGDELHRVDVDVEPAVWQQAVAGLAEVDLTETDNDGCDGGTGRSVQVDIAGDVIVEADLEVCGDDGRRDADELDALIAPLLAGLELEELLAPG